MSHAHTHTHTQVLLHFRVYLRYVGVLYCFWLARSSVFDETLLIFLTEVMRLFQNSTHTHTSIKTQSKHLQIQVRDFGSVKTSKLDLVFAKNCECEITSLFEQ